MTGWLIIIEFNYERDQTTLNKERKTNMKCVYDMHGIDGWFPEIGILDLVFKWAERSKNEKLNPQKKSCLWTKMIGVLTQRAAATSMCGL